MNARSMRYWVQVLARVGGGCVVLKDACVIRSFTEPLMRDIMPQKVRKNTKAVTDRDLMLSEVTSER